MYICFLIKTICTFIHSALLAHHYSPSILRKLFGVEDDLFTTWKTMGVSNLQESHGHLKYTLEFEHRKHRKKKDVGFPSQSSSLTMAAPSLGFGFCCLLSSEKLSKATSWCLWRSPSPCFPRWRHGRRSIRYLLQSSRKSVSAQNMKVMDGAANRLLTWTQKVVLYLLRFF